MRSILFVLALIVATAGSSQIQLSRKIQGGSNIFSYEGGMYHRGIIGASYNRLLVYRKHIFVAGGGGLGFGFVPFGKGINQFYYLNTSCGIGFESDGAKFHIGPGIEFKYINYYDSQLDAQNNYYSTHGQGIGFVPSVAFTFMFDQIFIQMRIAPFCLVKSATSSNVGVGVTFGKIF